MTASATLPATAWPGDSAAEEGILDRIDELERFLASVERRAFRIAQIAVGDRDEALDAVQDAMIRLARRYAGRPPAEWRPLFYRILRNRLRDAQRRRSVRARILRRLPGEGDETDPTVLPADPAPEPGRRVLLDAAMVALEAALERLPARQRQAFLLRTFEGLDVAQTALAMECSQGSVKTHYSRAVHTLRVELGEYW